jgi:hypothetical protein
MDAAHKKNQRCAVCYRELVSKGKKYCIYHSQAYDSLQKQYDAWVHAYGGISKIDYMNKLLTLSQTGSWVKEVINEELKTEHKKVGNWYLDENELEQASNQSMKEEGKMHVKKPDKDKEEYQPKIINYSQRYDGNGNKRRKDFLYAEATYWFL